jgi:hypothetical protein
MTKIRWIFVIGIVCLAVAIAGFRLAHLDPQIVEAAPVPPSVQPVKIGSIVNQAMTSAEVSSRGGAVVVEPMAVFRDGKLGYHLNYPASWEQLSLSSTVTLFQSPGGANQVKVEAAGPLPADGLSPFVERSLGNDIVFSRQALTVHGLPAERVVAFSELLDNQVTVFYINQDASVFVITGTGDQKSIEMIARSFNAPQLVAQR